MEQYCRRCGVKLEEGMRFCPSCGAAVTEAYPGQVSGAAPRPRTASSNGLAVAGFVVSLVSLLINFLGIVGIVGLILSGIGLSQASREGDNRRGMALAGVIIGALSTLWGFFNIIRLF